MDPFLVVFSHCVTVLPDNFNCVDKTCQEYVHIWKIGDERPKIIPIEQKIL